MDEIDGLLRTAGERWRASLKPMATIDTSALVQRNRGGDRLWRFAALATAVAVIVAVVALNSPPGRWLGVGGPPGTETGLTATPANAGSVAPDGCDVTRPTARFIPPASYPEAPPSTYGSEWFGSPPLWTMIGRDGEIWSDLPLGLAGHTQKTFWWSSEWSPAAEPEPAITVRGTRVDGQGSFAAGPGTNAGADFGDAMLVAVDVPTSGCWKISARYRDTVLSYVAWVSGDVVDTVTPEHMELGVLNATSKELVLGVNGKRVADLGPGTQVELPASRLPSLPWAAEVQLSEGRSLLSLTVREGDVVTTRNADGSIEQRGAGTRVDLSCGYIAMWSGPPLGGPAPGSGSPGDCDPEASG